MCKNNLVYEFSCSLGDCIANIHNQKTILNSYIGHTHLENVCVACEMKNDVVDKLSGYIFLKFNKQDV